MLIQSLLTAAIVMLLAGSILTSSLVAARSAVHEEASKNVALALDRGTAAFTTWAAQFVQAHTASGSWPTLAQSAPRKSMCSSSGQPCKLFESIAYQVTGSTVAGDDAPSGVEGSDVVSNLQTIVNEQRLSAEVTATVTSDTGVVLGSGTRELTARVFDAAPWAVVTGARDTTTVLGSVHAADGDTGGTKSTDVRGKPESIETPDPQHPSNFKDTVINIAMTCANSASNDDQLHPRLDNHAPGNSNLPWGVQLQHGAYEAPCSPTFGFSGNPPVPADAYIPTNGDYRVGVFAPAKAWTNGSTTSAKAWPQ